MSATMTATTLKYRTFNSLFPLPPSGTTLWYFQVLRKMLNSFGFNSTEIVAADEKFLEISTNILSDKELAEAVSIIG